MAAVISPELAALSAKGTVVPGLSMAAAGLEAVGRVEEHAFIVDLICESEFGLRYDTFASSAGYYRALTVTAITLCAASDTPKGHGFVYVEVETALASKFFEIEMSIPTDWVEDLPNKLG